VRQSERTDFFLILREDDAELVESTVDVVVADSRVCCRLIFDCNATPASTGDSLCLHSFLQCCTHSECQHSSQLFC